MATCCEHETPQPHTLQNPSRYRRVLWAALGINAAMCVVEVVAGAQAGSQSLMADAIDFAGDALNYGASLAVLSAALVWRSRMAMVKAVSMMGFGVWVLGHAAWSLWQGSTPNAAVMGVVSVLALLSNVAVAWMLYAFREGDANMRSVWLCSRNDAIGNVAVMLAAAGVYGTASAWPDGVVAVGMATLALHSGWQVFGQARREGALEAAHDHAH